MTNQSGHLLTFPINSLRRSPHNVRTLNAGDGIEGLSLSISETGLLQNLIGTLGFEDGVPVALIHGGGRRFAALKLLLEQDATITYRETRDGQAVTVQVPADDYRVPVLVFPSDEDAVSASLVENIQRKDMEPVDAFRAFAELARQGMTVPQIMRKVGKSKAYVDQHLALGRLHKTLLDRVAAGTLGMDSAQVLTLIPDLAEQLALVNQIETDPDRHNNHVTAWELRRAINKEKLACTTNLGRFIRERYMAFRSNSHPNGLPVTTDLFGGDAATMLDDGRAAHKLIELELIAASERLKAAGWSWVRWAFSDNELRSWEYKQQAPDLEGCLSDTDAAEISALKKANLDLVVKVLREQGDDDPVTENDLDQIEVDLSAEEEDVYQQRAARIAEMEEKTEGDWSPDLRGNLGCLVYIDFDARLTIKRGVMEKPGTKAAAVPAGDADAAPPPPDEPKMSEALTMDLTGIRTAAAQIAMCRAFRSTMTLHLATLWSKLEEPGLYWYSPSSITATYIDPIKRNADEPVDPEGAEATLDAYRRALRDILPNPIRDGDHLYTAIDDLDDSARQSMFAYLTARTFYAPMASKNPVAERISRNVKADIRRYWTPDGKTLLSRVSKGWQLDNLPSTLAPVLSALDRNKSKKGERVDLLEKCFANPEDVKDTTLDVTLDVGQIDEWLPPGMAFDEPEEAHDAEEAA